MRPFELMVDGDLKTLIRRRFGLEALGPQLLPKLLRVSLKKMWSDVAGSVRQTESVMT